MGSNRCHNVKRNFFPRDLSSLLDLNTNVAAECPDLETLYNIDEQLRFLTMCVDQVDAKYYFLTSRRGNNDQYTTGNKK